jgi:hypothetical protein
MDGVVLRVSTVVLVNIVGEHGGMPVGVSFRENGWKKNETSGL